MVPDWLGPHAGNQKIIPWTHNFGFVHGVFRNHGGGLLAKSIWTSLRQSYTWKIQGDAKCVCRDCVVLAHKTAAGIDRRELSLCLWSQIVGEECAINAMRYLIFSTCAFGNLSFTYFSSQSTQSVEIWRSTFPLLDKRMSTQSEEASNFKCAWFFPLNAFLPFCGLSLMVFEWTHGATICVPGKLAKNVFPYSQSWNTWCDNGWYIHVKKMYGRECESMDTVVLKTWFRSAVMVFRPWRAGRQHLQFEYK